MLDKKFIKYLLTNLLVVIGLIPIAILFGQLQQMIDNLYFWLTIGIVSFVLVSYMMYKNEERS